MLWDPETTHLLYFRTVYSVNRQFSTEIYLLLTKHIIVAMHDLSMQSLPFHHEMSKQSTRSFHGLCQGERRSRPKKLC